MRLVPLPPAALSGLIIIGCLAGPSARADGGYGPGSYAVPGQMAYGTYVAHAEPGDHPPACTFSTWTSDGKLIVADGGVQTAPVIAQLQAPAVAKFITHGCTPWTRAG